MWPMNLDLDSMGTPGSNNPNQQPSQQAQQANANVFMGATTPGASGNVM